MHLSWRPIALNSLPTTKTRLRAAYTPLENGKAPIREQWESGGRGVNREPGSEVGGRQNIWCCFREGYRRLAATLLAAGYPALGFLRGDKLYRTIAAQSGVPMGLMQ